MKHKTPMFETFGKNAGRCLSAAWPDFGLYYVFIFTIYRLAVSFGLFFSQKQAELENAGREE